MTGAFAICIILFLTFSALVSFIKNAFMPAVWEPDLSIASETNTCSIGHDLLEQVSQNNAIERVYGRMFAYDVPALISGEAHPANVISYEENQFNWVRDSLMEGSIDAVMQGENQVLFVYDESIPIHTGESITLIGLSDPDATIKGDLFGEVSAMVSTKLRNLTEGDSGYTVLLSHRPELFETYVSSDIDLVLSGHAHGGQFRLPFVGGLIAPDQGLFPKYDAGLYTEGETNMVVRKGLTHHRKTNI